MSSGGWHQPQRKACRAIDGVASHVLAVTGRRARGRVDKHAYVGVGVGGEEVGGGLVGGGLVGGGLVGGGEVGGGEVGGGEVGGGEVGGGEVGGGLVGGGEVGGGRVVGVGEGESEGGLEPGWLDAGEGVNTASPGCGGKIECPGWMAGDLRGADGLGGVNR